MFLCLLHKIDVVYTWTKHHGLVYEYNKAHIFRATSSEIYGTETDLVTLKTKVMVFIYCFNLDISIEYFLISA